jgi:Holliday junction resolvase-like predicted endonuclease
LKVPGKKVVPQGLIEMLQHRGLELMPWVKPRDLLLIDLLSSLRQKMFYERLKNYSFRLVLRDIIKWQEAFLPKDLTRFCSLSRVKEHLAFLARLGLIQVSRNHYRLLPGPIRSFGATLEWFVARIFEEEFHGEVLWGISFRKSTSGGDFDVVARVERELVYVEVKSSPPKHIEQGDVKAFLNRIEDLLPHLALFFVDTELRMKDKIVPLFEEELRSRHGKGISKRYPVVRMRDELFQISHQVFIVNSKREIIANFRDCFRDYWRGLIRI